MFDSQCSDELSFVVDASHVVQANADVCVYVHICSDIYVAFAAVLMRAH